MHLLVKALCPHPDGGPSSFRALCLARRGGILSVGEPAMYDETSHLLAGLIEQMPEEVHLDEPEPESAPETGSARSARERRDAADRKRAERARRRAEGIPEPALVDRAIATALSDLSRRRGLRARVREQKSFEGIAYGLADLVGQAMEELVERRGVRQQQAKAALMARLGLTRQA